MDGNERAEGQGDRVAWRLIERAANSTEPEVDPRLLKAVKFVVRSSEDETRATVRCLMDLIKKPNSQVAAMRSGLCPYLWCTDVQKQRTY